MKDMAAGNFWKVSKSFVSEESELFRKLFNGYAGQRDFERMNKTVQSLEIDKHMGLLL